MPLAGTRRWSASPILWAVGVLLLVAGAGLATWRLQPKTPAADATTSATSPARLVPGRDYYLHVKLIELSERRPDGSAWDRVGDSGPDIRFTLTWRQNVIWDALEKPDTLIGSWDLLKVDLRQILMDGGQADLESAINAPLINYQPRETVELKVWDSDTVGSDDAGTIQLKLDELSPGDNTIAPAAGETMAMKRVQVALIDRRTSLPELIDTVSKR